MRLIAYTAAVSLLGVDRHRPGACGRYAARSAVEGDRRHHDDYDGVEADAGG